MTRRIYALLAVAAAPALRLMLAARVRRGKEDPARLDERRGIDTTPRPRGVLVWLHAASVGETLSVLPVIQALADATPDLTVLMTTGTLTSAALLSRRLPELGLQARVLHRFVPLDVPAWAGRFLDHWRPDVAGFVESEIWPNLLDGCAARRIPAMLLNARLSPRSAARWRRLPGLARALFGAFDRVQAQSDGDAERLRAIGARHVTSPGNLKFAAPPLPVAQAELDRLGALLGGRPVWLSASTHPGEEATVLEVHEALRSRHPGLLTIIAPRHPNRGEQVAALVVGGPAPRRSAGQDPPTGAGIWVADTMGDLGLLYRLARCAFVGGSLIPRGGQNPLEAARLGCPVAVGPGASNFADIVAGLAAAGALEVVTDAPSLTRWVDAMLRDPACRACMSDAGIAAASRHADLPRLTAAALLDLVRC